MWSSFRQNAVFFMLVVLTLNMLVVSALGAVSLAKALTRAPAYDIIDCADKTGRVHRCIRVDAKAGEFNNAASGASYRVIYGQ